MEVKIFQILPRTVLVVEVVVSVFVDFVVLDDEQFQPS